MEKKIEWIKCPVCGNKTRNMVRQDTVLRKFPLFCPKCKNETIIDLSDFVMKIVEEPDA